MVVVLLIGPKRETPMNPRYFIALHLTTLFTASYVLFTSPESVQGSSFVYIFGESLQLVRLLT